MSVHNLGPVHVQADASGIHEVMVITPDHSASWKDLDDEASAMVMAALRNRMADQARQSNIRYTQAIVNQGRRQERRSPTPRPAPGHAVRARRDRRRGAGVRPLRRRVHPLRHRRGRTG